MKINLVSLGQEYLDSFPVSCDDCCDVDCSNCCEHINLMEVATELESRASHR